VILVRELGGETVEHVAGVSEPREEDQGWPVATPIENFQAHVTFDGD